MSLDFSNGNMTMLIKIHLIVEISGREINNG
jgi:hypothetical protein